LDNSYAKLERNLRILKDSPRAEWLQKIEKKESVKNCISKLLKWQVKSRKYYEKEKYTILPEVYWKWYCQRKGNSWKEFDKWITKNYLPDVMRPVLEMETIK